RGQASSFAALAKLAACPRILIHCRGSINPSGMRRSFSLLFLAALSLPAQDLPPGVLTLARIHDRVREAVERLPDCTCVETVARFRKSAGKDLKPVDRAVLQILSSGVKELFASPSSTTRPSSGTRATNLPPGFAKPATISRFRGCRAAIPSSAGALPARRPCAAPSGPIPKRTIFAD